MWERLMNFYNTSAAFHSFVVALEYAAISFITSYQGGVPSSKAGWLALGGAFLGALVGGIKRWLATNVATQGLRLK